MWLRPVSIDPTTSEVEIEGTGRKLRTRRDLPDLGLADRRLALPRMRPADIHPARVHPGDPGAREHRVPCVLRWP
jgi:hypothetical protein